MPTHRLAVLPALTAVAVAVAVGVAGCRSGDSSTAAAPSVSPTGTAASPTAPPTSSAPTSIGSVLTTLPAACPTAAVVSSTLGISAATPDQSRTPTTLDCEYVGTSAADTVSINFTIAKKLTPAQAEAALKAQGTSSKFQSVPGLGDAAFYDAPPTGGSYIAVLSGSLSFHVVDGGAVAASNMTALVQVILAG